jgi:L-glutamine-phosphate cytidylyltransferase
MSTIAFILAAGRGARLRPITDRVPKCLVKLAGRSLLERQCSALRHAGIEDIHVITGYRAAAIEALGYSTIHNPHFETTNMVATLFCARALMTGTADVVIAYGDIVFELEIVHALLAEDAPLATAIDRGWLRYWSLRMADPLSDAETLRLSRDGDVVELGKRPGSLEEIEGQYMGLTKIRADHVRRFRRAWEDLDPSGCYDGRDKANMFMTSFLSVLIAAGWRLRAVPVEHGWLEVDRVSDLDLYHRLLETDELSSLYNHDATWPARRALARAG